MRLINKFFYKLGDVDTKVPMKEKLQKCLELDIPVIIKVPGECNVWAIDHQLHKLTKKDIILSESDFCRKVRLINYFYNFENAPFSSDDIPRINTSSISASTLIDNAEYVQLFSGDIKRLIASEDVKIDQFQGVVTIDASEYMLKQSVPVSRYYFKLDCVDENKTIHSLYQKFKLSDANLNFVFCGKQVTSNNEFNFPIVWGEGKWGIYSTSAIASECSILEEDVSKLVFNDIAYKKSPYHLESEYHASTAFLELSKAGFDLYVKKVAVVSGGNSGYLTRNFSNFKKKNLSEAGAFLIKKEGANFKVLKGIYNNHWLPEKKLTKTKSQEITDNVLMDLDHLIKTNEAYTSSIEFIIRPDKYK